MLESKGNQRLTRDRLNDNLDRLCMRIIYAQAIEVKQEGGDGKEREESDVK